MKKYILLAILSHLGSIVFSQNNPKKIKIILIGTFHFNQKLDSTKPNYFNPNTVQRQKEINEIVNKLAKQKPDKIFLEFSAKNQPFYDSVYTDYLNGIEPKRPRTKANEIFQIGMKTAKILGHKNVIGMNYQPQELQDADYKPKNTVDKAIQDLYFALGNFEDSTRTNTKFYDLPFPYKMPKQDSLLKKSTLSQYILHINTDKKLQQADYNEWNYFYSMGTGADMSSMEYVSTFWYGANLRNYNNVLRQVDYEKDKCYLIIYGTNHIPFLKHLFTQNPYFEIVDLNKILK